MEITDVCERLTPAAIAQLAGVDETTARRWRRGRAMPAPARRLLELLTVRELSSLSRAWRGWRLTEAGLLLSPEDWAFTPGELCASRVLREQGDLQPHRAELTRARLRSLPRIPRGAQCDWISGRWLLPMEPLEGIQAALAAPYVPEFWRHLRDPWERSPWGR